MKRVFWDQVRQTSSLAERLTRQADSTRLPILSSEDAIKGTQAKTDHLLRTLNNAPNDVAPLWSASNDWKPEQWKNDWGPDRLVPAEIKDSRREQPPHIGRQPPHIGARPPLKSYPTERPKPFAFKVKIEGLIEPSDTPVLQDLVPPREHKPISTLKHGLERVLFNPGVHWLRDPRSRVYNFPPYLENIPKVTEFAFERLPGFIKSSRDEDLRTMAKQESRLFSGSTSSLTGMLSHCYFLISEHKGVDISSLSQSFQGEETNFTPGQRMPSSVLFNYKDGVYAIDSDSEDSSKNILTWLGTLLEKFLTMTKTEFATYLRSSPPVEGQDDPTREAYRYSKSEKFVMRSQLDGVDKRLPGTGVFDIKTRACVTVRMDLLNWEENSGYTIKTAQGSMESFEKEYYDLIRSAFLKYGFQVRIGNMDGVIVAYHNTARMFGFQYISIEEMDNRLFGTQPGVGDRIFQKCVGLLEGIASEVVQCFPEQTVKCTFECEESSQYLNVWVQPAEWQPTDEQPLPPIKQLAIRVQSFLDDSPASGPSAIAAPSSMQWTIHWTLAHVSHSEEHIRNHFAACMERQFRAYNIPTGVTLEALPEFWRSLNFGGEPRPAAEEPETAEKLAADFDMEKFRKPTFYVKLLRKLARSGRAFTRRQEEAEAGNRKVVLGEPVGFSEDELEEYQAEEDRDFTNDQEQRQAMLPDSVTAPNADLELDTLLAEPAPESIADSSTAAASTPSEEAVESRELT